VRYWEIPINHSDPEVMLTNVVLPLSAELWFHDGGICRWSKDMELVKSNSKAINGDNATHMYCEASNSNPGWVRNRLY